MTITLEVLLKGITLISVLIGIYLIWRKRVQKEVNNERDIRELKERQERDKAELQKEIMNNRDEIRALKDYYGELTDRLLDNLFPKRNIK
jgi:hypothetical protein